MRPCRRRVALAPAAIILFVISIADAQPPQIASRVTQSATAPVRTGNRTLRLTRDDGQPVIVTALATDPRGEVLVVAGDDQTIRILDGVSLRTEQILREHRDTIRTIRFDAAGDRLVSAGNDGQLIVWRRGEPFEIIQRIDNAPALRDVCFAPDGSEIAAVGFDNQVFVLGKRGSRTPSFRCDCRDLRVVTYRDDGEVMAVAGRSGHLHLFDRAGGELIGEHRLHRSRITDARFVGGTDRVVTVGEDGRLVVFDTVRQQVISETEVTGGRLFAVEALDSVHVAVAGSENEILVINLDRGEVVRRLRGHLGSVPALAMNRGVLHSGGFDATLRQWKIGDLDEAERVAATPGETER